MDNGQLNTVAFSDILCTSCVTASNLEKLAIREINLKDNDQFMRVFFLKDDILEEIFNMDLEAEENGIQVWIRKHMFEHILFQNLKLYILFKQTKTFGYFVSEIKHPCTSEDIFPSFPGVPIVSVSSLVGQRASQCP